ncbi:RidA family protein [Paraburkholderia megapolitana]|nr:RidA family protein [Paraburkholderia megapolitana]
MAARFVDNCSRAPRLGAPHRYRMTDYGREHMTIQLHNPANIVTPFSRYSHGASAPATARWLHISGQVGVTPDGAVPEDVEKQMELAWDNLFAVLADAGMAVTDLVKVDGFITRADLVPLYRTVRERRLAGHATASTLVIVAGLVVPTLHVEIQAVAAK